MPAEARETVEEAELEEVTDAEIGNRAEVGRKFVVLYLLFVSRARILQAVWIVEQRNGILRFTSGIAAMLLLPPLECVQVVVVECAVKVDHPSGDLHMLVHRAVLETPPAVAPETEKPDAVGAVTDIAAHEPSPKLEGESIDIVERAVRKHRFETFDGVGRKVLVGVQSQDPTCLNRQVVECPVELLRVEPRPLVFDKVNSWSLKLELEGRGDGLNN